MNAFSQPQVRERWRGGSPREERRPPSCCPGGLSCCPSSSPLQGGFRGATSGHPFWRVPVQGCPGQSMSMTLSVAPAAQACGCTISKVARQGQLAWCRGTCARALRLPAENIRTERFLSSSAFLLLVWGTLIVPAPCSQEVLSLLSSNPGS